MKSRRIFSFFVAFILLVTAFSALAGCSGTGDDPYKWEVTTAEPDGTMRQKVRIMSYNISADESTVPERAPGLLSTILKYGPDSVGIQEARGSWPERLDKALGEKYDRVGVDAGGNKDATGAYFATYIFYLKDKYNVIDSGTFWLSKTPDTPSQYDASVDCPRTCTWVILENKITGFRYVHLNSHLDWMNMDVNYVQIQMIAKQIMYFYSMGYPVFATGDYNADEGCPSYEAMLAWNEEIADSKYIAAKTMDMGTYPDFGKYDVKDTEKNPPIDYCFVSKSRVSVAEYKVIDEKPDGKWSSDHYPIFTESEASYKGVLPDEGFVPAFSESPTVEIKKNNVIFHVKPALDSYGNAAVKYTVEIYDASGEKYVTKTLKGNMYSIELPAELILKVIHRNPGNYTAEITPVSLLGLTGTPVKLEYESFPA